MSPARGLVATGVYVPRMRLDGEAVEAGVGAPPPVDRVAVPAADEDALTMAVAAGRDALDGSDVPADAIGHLAVATTTPPTEEGEFAPRAASALGLDADCRIETATRSTASGADALRSAAAAAGPALAVVADAPAGDPAGIGRRMGAGAAAFCFAADGAVALVDAATRSRDAPGLRFRERGSETVDELGITTYERETVRDLVSTAVDALDVDLEAVGGASLHQPTPDVPRRIARSLPFDPEALDRGTVVDGIGDAGAATPAIGLLAALDASEPGSTTVAGFFGSGARAVALGFETREPIATGVARAIDGGEDVPFARALRERGTIGRTSVAGGGAHVSLPSWQRTIPQRYRLVAGRCPDCGAVAFPPAGACPGCHGRVDYEPIELPRTGEVVAATVVERGGAPPEFAELVRRHGPYAVAVVELSAGAGTARLPVQLTDCNPREPSVGDRVVARFRRIYEDEGVVRYGLKFAPE